MTMFSFYKATDRKTEAYVVCIGDYTLYISYSTVVGVYGPDECIGRRHNEWGPTTGRHMREMGISDYPEVDEGTINSWINRAIADTGMAIIEQRLGGKAA